MGILKDTKQVLGVDGDDHSFDVDITMHINSALMILRQTGALPAVSKIVDDSTSWGELFPPTNGLWAVQSYVYLRCRIWFDPPSNSFVQTAIEKQISELEWRLCVYAESESK